VGHHLLLQVELVEHNLLLGADLVWHSRHLLVERAEHSRLPEQVGEPPNLPVVYRLIKKLA